MAGSAPQLRLLLMFPELQLASGSLTARTAHIPCASSQPDPTDAGPEALLGCSLTKLILRHAMSETEMAAFAGALGANRALRSLALILPDESVDCKSTVVLFEQLGHNTTLTSLSYWCVATDRAAGHLSPVSASTVQFKSCVCSHLISCFDRHTAGGSVPRVLASSRMSWKQTATIPHRCIPSEEDASAEDSDFLEHPSGPLSAMLRANSTLTILDLAGVAFAGGAELLAVAAALAENNSVRLFGVRGVRCGPIPLAGVSFPRVAL